MRRIGSNIYEKRFYRSVSGTERSFVTEEQLQEVLANRRSKRRLFGDVIIDMKLVTDVPVLWVLAEH